MSLENKEVLENLKARYIHGLQPVWDRYDGECSRVRNAVYSKANMIAKERGRSAPNLELRSATVGQWFRRGSLPMRDGSLFQEALARLVEEAIADSNAKEVEPFRTVIQEFSEAHDRSRRTRGGKVSAAQVLDNLEYLVHPVVPVRRLDRQKLNLGSRLAGGEVPSYCEREADEELLRRFNSGDTKLVVLIGPPKSGKTRTLIEALGKSSKRSSDTYWLMPKPDVFRKFTSLVRSSVRGKTVIVLDDLEAFHFDSNGLNSFGLNQLTQRGLVVATLHADVLERWEADVSETSTSPSRSFVELIRDATVELSSTFTENEVENARTVLKSHATEKIDFIRMPSWMSSADALLAKAKGMQAGTPFEKAAIAAVVDARILRPEGIDLDGLQELFRAELRKIAPNIPWIDRQWDEVLFELTSPITESSPHSILIAIKPGTGPWQIMDALWDGLKPREWTRSHLDLGDLKDFDVGWREYEAGIAEGRLILESTSGEGIPEALNYFGMVLKREGDLLGAESRWRLASSLGNVLAQFNLGSHLVDSGKIDEGEGLYRESASQGNVKAMNNLGVILARREQFHEAREWFQKAADGGNAVATHNLGLDASDRGDFDLAESLFRESIDGGYAKAAGSLGLLFEHHGKLREAEESYRIGATLKDADSFFYLGNLHVNNGEFLEAEGCFEASMDLGSYAAAHNLGSMLEKRGQLEEAERYYRMSIDVGDTWGFESLGVLLANRGEIHEAGELFLRSAEAGSVRAVFLAGLLAFDQGDLVEAELRIREASSLGWEEAKVRLGSLLASQGRFDEADFEYREAVEAGIPGAPNTFGMSLEERGSLDIAKSFYELGAEQGDPDALTNLGRLAAIQGIQDLARKKYEQAFEMGSPEAINQLGLWLEVWGALEEATEAFTRGMKAGNANSAQNLGRLAFEGGDLLSAEEYARESVKLGNATGINDLGVLQEREGLLAEAEALYKESSGLGVPVATYNLARLLASRGELVEAESLYREAADLGQPLALNNLGLLLERRGDVVEAEALYKESSGLGVPVATYNFARLLASRGELVEAESLYRQAIDLGSASAMNGLGVFLERRGDLVEADSLYRQAAELGDPLGMYNSARLLANRGELVEAESLYRRAVDLGSASAMNGLGAFLERRGDLVEAEVLYRQAAELGDPLAMYNSGRIVGDRGDIAERDKFYKNVLETTSKSPNHLSAEPMLAASSVLFRQGHFERVVSLLGAYPHFGDWALLILGLSTLRLGNLQDAEPFLQQATETNRGIFLLHYGHLLSLLGRKKEAATWLNKGKKVADWCDLHWFANDLRDAGFVDEADTWEALSKLALASIIGRKGTLD